MATNHLFTDGFFAKIPKPIMDEYKEFNLRYLNGIVNLQPGSKSLRGRNVPHIVNGNMTFKGLSSKLLETCRNGLNLEYIGKAMQQSIKTAMSSNNWSQHEILLITKITGDESQYSEISVKNIRTENILGFIIIQVGECRLYPSIPALKIICSTDGQHSSKVSNFLMYVYLRALKENKHEYGLLEVAGNYKNPGALCLYNKFGFREDALLDEKGCFGETGTLAMRANLNNMAYDDLDDVILKNVPIKINAPEPMCEKGSNIGPMGNDQKRYIGIRKRNRKYLDDFFKFEDSDTTAELLTALDIDLDVLVGDGTADNGKLYAKKELIEKGKSIALNDNQTIKQFFNKSQQAKKIKQPSVDSADSNDSNDSPLDSPSAITEITRANDRHRRTAKTHLQRKQTHLKRKTQIKKEIAILKKGFKHRDKTAKNLNVKRKRQSSNTTSKTSNNASNTTSNSPLRKVARRTSAHI